MAGPTHHKLLFEDLVMTFEIRMAVVDEINYPIQGEFNIVASVLFNGCYRRGVDVFQLDIKGLGKADAAFSEKNSSAVILPNVFW